MPSAGMMLSRAGGGVAGPTGYYQSLTHDHTKIGSTDLTNYPVLISLTDVHLKSVANGGHVDNTGVNNIWFSSTSNGTTSDKIPFSIQKWDATTGQLIAWVRASSLSHTTNTLFGYLRYGDSTQTSDVSNEQGIWDSSFRHVLHGGKNGVVNFSGNWDASSYNQSVTLGGTGNPTAVTGKIDTAGSSDNAHAYHVLYDNTSYGSGYSWSLWWKAASNPGSGSPLKIWGHDNPYFTMDWSHNNPIAQQAVEHKDGSSNFFVAKYATSLVGGTWYLLTGQWDGSNNLKAYLNGALETTTTGVTSLASIGVGGHFNYVIQETGTVEEMRLSTGTRSDSWILADYNSQNSPSTFVTYGTETAL